MDFVKAPNTWIWRSEHDLAPSARERIQSKVETRYRTIETNLH